MAKEGGITKFDPNTEAFQMRAEWKKAEICRKMWHDQWSWLLDERRKALEKSQEIRKKAAAVLPLTTTKVESEKSLKPVPLTTKGLIGWLSTRPDCQLEIYTPWRLNIPIKAPDAWEKPNYEPPANRQ